MKILILDTNYPSFLQAFYSHNPDAKSLSYSEQQRAIMAQCFGTADFYSSNLMKLGHEAEEVVVNNKILQHEWAVENGIKPRSRWLPSLHIYRDEGGIRINLGRKSTWLLDILHAQIRNFSPDVLYVQNISWLPGDFLRDIRQDVHLIVGQHASLLPPDRMLHSYDLILSSLPNMVSYFREQGITSEYFRLGFEPKVLTKLSSFNKKFNVVHIGGYGPIHNERTVFLESVSKKTGIEFWGYGIDNVPPSSSIHQSYHGEAWGLDMYNIRHNSKISVNKHISSVADGFCNNCTLYEATGVGTCLVTDMKDNLSELYDPDREVVAYTSPDDCAEKIHYLLDHEDERLSIARAGKERTLGEHTYYHRMQELAGILESHLRHPEHVTRSLNHNGN